MKPGDTIEWVKRPSDTVLNKDEFIWSSVMEEWIPVGRRALLISVADNVYTWLSEKGLFHALVADTGGWIGGGAYMGDIVPRAIKEGKVNHEYETEDH